MPKMKTQATTHAETLSITERLTIIERAIVDLHNALSQLHVARSQSSHLPILPDGSGLALAEARKRAGWPGRELAKAIGVSPSTLSMWECERIAIPRWRAEAIAAVFVNAEAAPPWEAPGA